MLLPCLQVIVTQKRGAPQKVCLTLLCSCPLQRLAVFEACSLLKKYQKEYNALQEAMKNGASIAKCVQTIEEA